MKIKITTEDVKQRLDKFLTRQLPITRSQIKKLIQNGDILLNAQPVSVHYFLRENDLVNIDDKKIKIITTVKKLEANPAVKFKIVYEDDDIMVIDKKSGLLVHPTEKMEDDTLVNGLLSYYPKIKKVGEDKLRPGIVHRIDKNVSGLVLVCKNQPAFNYFKKQFQERLIKKNYTALVHGTMEKTEGTIDMPISRSQTKGKMAVKSKEQGGKEAITKYTVVKQYKNFALLSVEILTGRTHQIRAHFNAIQHPIVGDKLYTQKWVKEKLDLNRPFLHSTQLGFTNLSGEEQEFKSPLPAKLRKIIKELV